jgi:hypothetical protein
MVTDRGQVKVMDFGLAQVGVTCPHKLYHFLS